MSTVSGISSVNYQYQTNTQNTFQQDFQALGNALQQNNLSAAQQAFSTLQTDMQGNQSNGTQQQSQNSTLSTDFNNLASDSLQIIWQMPRRHLPPCSRTCSRFRVRRVIIITTTITKPIVQPLKPIRLVEQPIRLVPTSMRQPKGEPEDQLLVIIDIYEVIEAGS